jgi:pullulanase/glycogen debranching enzyme
LQPGDVVWHGTEPYKPDFNGQTLAMVLDGRRTDREPDRDFYVAFNAWRAPVTFTIPPSPQGRLWRRVVDTQLASPMDIVLREEAPVIQEWSRYTLAGFAMMVLVGEG